MIGPFATQVSRSDNFRLVFAEAMAGEVADALRDSLAVRQRKTIPVCLDKGQGTQEGRVLVADRDRARGREVGEERGVPLGGSPSPAYFQKITQSVT
jgi:hypothetical protein